MEKAFQLAILNARVYQIQLENVYAAALPVTLQRFSFSPQAVAGLSPTTAGRRERLATSGRCSPTVNPVNSFLYNTRATGSQLSTLNYGTVAGVGKLLDNGTRILASFASQVVFNFVGRNPTQPTVKSFLPLQVFVPFLRGGGRALTLEALTQAERNLVYAVRSFAKFRQEFVVTTLVGGRCPELRHGVPASASPAAATPTRRPASSTWSRTSSSWRTRSRTSRSSSGSTRSTRSWSKGESSGLSPLQLDQIRQQVQNARLTVLNSRLTPSGTTSTATSSSSGCRPTPP